MKCSVLNYMTMWCVLAGNAVRMVAAAERRSSSCTKNCDESEESFLNALLANYNPEVRPGANTGTTTVDHISLQISSISSIREQSMDYQMTFYLTQWWLDPRLRFSKYNHSMILNYRHLEKLWIPDVFVVNEREAKSHLLPTPNRLIRIWPSGMVMLDERFTMVLTCPMKLYKFPLDDQTCSVTFESYGHTEEYLRLVWDKSKVKFIGKGTVLPEFYIRGNETKDCTRSLNLGVYSCVEAEIHLRRNWHFYLFHTYIPSMLIVILSWANFWIDYQAVAGRVSLGLLTVLTMTTQSSSVNARLPKVSYIKAVDVWLVTCLAYVFGAFLEFALVNVIHRNMEEEKHVQTIIKKIKERRASAIPKLSSTFTLSTSNGLSQNSINSINTIYEDKVVEDSSSSVSTPTTETTSLPHSRQRRKSVEERSSTSENEASIQLEMVGKRIGGMGAAQQPKVRHFYAMWKGDKALMIDVVSRIVFPFTFLVFNIIYWMYYIFNTAP